MILDKFSKPIDVTLKSGVFIIDSNNKHITTSISSLNKLLKSTPYESSKLVSKIKSLGYEIKDVSVSKDSDYVMMTDSSNNGIFVNKNNYNRYLELVDELSAVYNINSVECIHGDEEFFEDVTFELPSSSTRLPILFNVDMKYESVTLGFIDRNSSVIYLPKYYKMSSESFVDDVINCYEYMSQTSGLQSGKLEWDKKVYFVKVDGLRAHELLEVSGILKKYGGRYRSRISEDFGPYKDELEEKILSKIFSGSLDNYYSICSLDEVLKIIIGYIYSGYDKELYPVSPIMISWKITDWMRDHEIPMFSY